MDDLVAVVPDAHFLTNMSRRAAFVQNLESLLPPEFGVVIPYKVHQQLDRLTGRIDRHGLPVLPRSIEECLPGVNYAEKPSDIESELELYRRAMTEQGQKKFKLPANMRDVVGTALYLARLGGEVHVTTIHRNALAILDYWAEEESLNIHTYGEQRLDRASFVDGDVELLITIDTIAKLQAITPRDTDSYHLIVADDIPFEGGVKLPIVMDVVTANAFSIGPRLHPYASSIEVVFGDHGEDPVFFEARERSHLDQSLIALAVTHQPFMISFYDGSRQLLEEFSVGTLERSYMTKYHASTQMFLDKFDPVITRKIRNI